MGVYPLSQLHYMKPPLAICMMFSLGSCRPFLQWHSNRIHLTPKSRVTQGVLYEYWTDWNRVGPAAAMNFCDRAMKPFSRPIVLALTASSCVCKVKSQYWIPAYKL
jgi:hypothetical protein